MSLSLSVQLRDRCVASELGYAPVLLQEPLCDLGVALFSSLEFPQTEIARLKRLLPSVRSKVCHADFVWWITRVVSQHSIATGRCPTQGDRIEAAVTAIGVTLETGGSMASNPRPAMPNDPGQLIDLRALQRRRQRGQQGGQ